MNNRLLILLLFALGLSNCTKENIVKEKLNFQWTLVEYANILGEVYCTYEEGDIIWSFEDDLLKINGRLITPWEYTPCYKLDLDYTKDLTFVIEETDNEDIIYIEDLDLRAKISFAEEFVLEIISSSQFNPSTKGVKVFFKKI